MPVSRHADESVDPWDDIVFEARMVFGLSSALAGEGFNSQPAVVKDALTESVCRHVKTPIEILLSNSLPPPGTRLDYLLPHFRSAALDQLRSEYEGDKSEGSAYWVLHSMLGPASQRSSRIDCAQVAGRLILQIERVWHEIESLVPGSHAAVIGRRERLHIPVRQDWNSARVGDLVQAALAAKHIECQQPAKQEPYVKLSFAKLDDAETFTVTLMNLVRESLKAPNKKNRRESGPL